MINTSRLPRELRDAAGLRLAGVPIDHATSSLGSNFDRERAGRGAVGNQHEESGISTAAALPPSLGDFTAAEYDRLSRSLPQSHFDARDKSHYRAFDEVGRLVEFLGQFE